MITYYKKLYITTIDNLCEAIQCSLSEVLTSVYSISVYYDAPSTQIRIIIKFEDRCTINIKLEPDEYRYLLDVDCASEWDYGNFIAGIKNDIRDLILRNYMQ